MYLHYRNTSTPGRSLTTVTVPCSPHYEQIEIRHEYEDLAKYSKTDSKVYEEVKPLEDKQQVPSGDYDFDKCPAYPATFHHFVITENGYDTIDKVSFEEEHTSDVYTEREYVNIPKGCTTEI